MSEDAIVTLRYKVYRVTDNARFRFEYESHYKPACMQYISEQPLAHVYQIRMVVTTNIDEGTFYGDNR